MEGSVTTGNIGFVRVCADCGASDPTWASINHGILICSECCFIHRNLGRHISQVRSLTKGMWSGKQLDLMHYLYMNGSNNIWEHALIDSDINSTRAKRKPVSNDPVIPKKEAFIQMKYTQLAYAIRPAKDECGVDDLNRQLWSCVRTSHVETALRLLSLGASPNYSDEQGNTSLHIATKNNQYLQVELLWIYGADVKQRNADGQIPADVAKSMGNKALEERLIELEFEVADRFSLFLCGRRPSHYDGQHFLIPDLIAQDRSDFVKKYRRLMQHSLGTIFERLVQDVYDEVDRREINFHWETTAESIRVGNLHHIAMFLPPNSRLSATRNQLRQKLAKFNISDFAHLIIDILKEIRRRYLGLPVKNEKSVISENKDFNFVDSAVEYLDSQQKARISSETKHSSEKTNFMEDSNLAFDNYLELKEKLSSMSEQMSQLTSCFEQTQRKIECIQKTVDQQQVDQTDIRQELSQVKHLSHHQPHTSSNSIRQATPPLQNSSLAVNQIGAVLMPASSLVKRAERPAHNYSTDTYPSAKIITRPGSNPTSEHITANFSTSMTALQQKNGAQQEQEPSLAKKTSLVGRHNPLTQIDMGNTNRTNLFQKDFQRTITVRQTSSTTPATGPMTASNLGNKDFEMKAIFNDEVFPDNLILETEMLTNAIKAMLSDLQNRSADCASPESNAMFHADSINHHIVRILGVIPQDYMRSGPVQRCAMEMESAMKQLSRRCLARPLKVDETCQAAYNVARAAKELLVTVHQRAEES